MILYNKVGWEALEGAMIQQIQSYQQYASNLDVPELKSIIKEKPKNNKSDQLRAAIKSMKGEEPPAEPKKEEPKKGKKK